MAKKSLKELQDFWYARLAKEGFVDAEDRQGRLKEWHGSKYGVERAQYRKGSKEAYLQKAEAFTLRPVFDAVVDSEYDFSRDLTKEEIRNIWGKHLEGFSGREIAREVGYSKATVNRLIGRIQTWMKLV